MENHTEDPRSNKARGVLALREIVLEYPQAKPTLLMMTKYLLRVVPIATGIVVAAFLPLAVQAQSLTEGLQIKPAIVQDKVVLGGSYEYSITVKNVAEVQKVFFLTTEDIKGLDDEGLPVFNQGGLPTGYELSSWISLPSSAITLEAGETKTISFAVHVPQKAAPGDHFGAIFLTNKPDPLSTSGSGVGISVATIVSLTIAGDIREEAQLREFSTDKTVYGTADVAFTSKIENFGNALLRPNGVIQITDMFGKDAGSIQVNQSGAPVFPGSSRKYVVTWEHDGLSFGRYQAVASFSYGESDKQSISGTTSFWILPLKPIAIALGVLLAIILVMYGTIRMYVRRKLRDMGIAAGSSDASYYAHRYQRSGSRMIIVTLVVFLVCVLFLSVLFLAFA